MKFSTTLNRGSSKSSIQDVARYSKKVKPESIESITVRTNYLLSFCNAGGNGYISVIFERLFDSASYSESETKFVSLDELIDSEDKSESKIGSNLKKIVILYAGKCLLRQSQNTTSSILESLIDTGNCYLLANGQRHKIRTLDELRPSRNPDIEVEEIFTDAIPVLEKKQIVVSNRYKGLLELGYGSDTKIEALQLFIKYRGFKIDPAPHSSTGTVSIGPESIIRDPDFEQAIVRKLRKWGLVKVINNRIYSQAQGKAMYFVAPPSNYECLANLVEKLIPFFQENFETAQIRADSSFKPMIVTNYVGKIEEHGNFRFKMELNVEVNGKLYPLLPILVEALNPLNRDFSFKMLKTLNQSGYIQARLPDNIPILFPFERINRVIKSLTENFGKSILYTNHKSSMLLDQEEYKRLTEKGLDKIILVISESKLEKTLEDFKRPAEGNRSKSPVNTKVKYPRALRS